MCDILYHPPPCPEEASLKILISSLCISEQNSLIRPLTTAALPENRILSPDDRASVISTNLVLCERQQGREALAADRTHVMLGRAAVRLSVLAETALGEEGPGTHVALVVPFDEVRLLLSGT